MVRALGAQAAGMSTVHEVVALRHMGTRVGALSCITNLAAGIGPKPLTHEEVALTANRAAGVFNSVLRAFVPAASRL